MRQGEEEQKRTSERKGIRSASSPLISHLSFKNTTVVRTETLTYTHTLKHRGVLYGGYSILQVLGNWSVVPLEKTADFIGSANRTFVSHVSLFQGARGARHRESPGSIVGTDPAIPECIQPQR